MDGELKIDFKKIKFSHWFIIWLVVFAILAFFLWDFSAELRSLKENYYNPLLKLANELINERKVIEVDFAELNRRMAELELKLKNEALIQIQETIVNIEKMEHRIIDLELNTERDENEMDYLLKARLLNKQ